MGLSVVQEQLFSFFNLVKVVSLKSTLEFFKSAVEKLATQTSSSEAELCREICSINRIIKSYDLEIVESVDEVTTQKIFVLISTADNDFTRKSKFYDESTLKLFSKIIKECVTSEKGHVSQTHCLNLSSELGITKLNIQSIIEKLSKDKWLVLMDGLISLGMRTILELEQSIKLLYSNDIRHCSFCKLVVFKGYNCDNCKKRYHLACLKKYVAQIRSNCVCPNCKNVWNDAISYLNVTINENVCQNNTEETVAHSSQAPLKKKKKNN